MRRRACLLLAAAALAGAPCGAEIPITGVVQAGSGAPLAGASVELLPVRSAYEAGLDALAGRLEPEPAAGAVTGDDGFFALAAPEPGLWAVRAAAPGFVPMIARPEPLAEELPLPAVTLRTDERLAVRVRDPGGKPVAGALVVGYTRSPDLWRRRPPYDRQHWDRAASTAITNDAGRAMLQRAAGEAVDVYAFAPGLTPARARAGAGPETDLMLSRGRQAVVEVGDGNGRPVSGVLVVFGGASWPLGRTGEDGRLAAALPAGSTLRALSEDGGRGQARLERNLDTVPLTLTVPPRIHGTVIDEKSRLPLAGALVWSGWGGEQLARTDAGGRFSLPDEQGRGRLVLQAWAAGYFPEFLSASETRRPEPVVALRPAASASGEVVDNGGNPVVGAMLRVQLLLEDYQPPRLTRPGSGARSHAGGRFRVGGIFPGIAVALEASAPGYAPATLRLPPLEAHENRAGLRLVLTPGAVLSGRLRAGGEPVVGAELSLLREPETSSPMAIFRSRRPDNARAAASDGAGRFELANLSAGRYLLRVAAAGYALLNVPGVTLPESGGTDLGDLELEPGARITGIVVDEEGRPVEGAEVRASGRYDAEMLFWLGGQEPAAVTAADGRFVVTDRRPGERVDIAVTKASDPGLLPASIPAVEAPSTTPLQIVLERGARVTGTVVDPSGAPVADARVTLRAEARSARGALGRHDRIDFQTHSDAAGGFAFDSVAPGILHLSAWAEGWIGAELSGLEVPPGGELAGLRLVLERGATVTGRVLDGDGQPAVGVHVRLEEPGSSRLPGVMSQQTAADGGYALYGIAPGLRVIVAERGRFNRTAREIEVAPGVNRLDLRFAAGVQVSGRVVDADGSPVAGATVELLDAAEFPSGPAASSAEDGGFVLEQVRDGRYLLRVSRAGYARTTRREPLEVAGLPVSGIELTIARGGTITGRLLGLEPAQRGAVRVAASRRADDFALGQIGQDGSYRIIDLEAGVWDVRAVVPEGPQARGRATLAPGVDEVRLDLELGRGLTLTGRVVGSGAAVAGVDVYLRGADLEGFNSSTTDLEGRFRLAGLEPGRYRLEVHGERALLHHEDVELDGDRDIEVEVRTGRVAGRVVDADGGAPVAGADVSLEPEAEIFGELLGSGTYGLASDARGSFVVGEVAAGAYRLRILKRGYAPAERRIQVPPGGGPEDLELALEPSGGLRLAVRGATGAPVAEVNYAVLDTAGRPLADGRLPADEAGGVRLPSVPSGSFDLLLAAPGSAVTRLRVTTRESVLAVQLQPGCALEVAVAALEAEQIVATMRIQADNGTPFWGLARGWAKREWLLRFGARTVTGLPAGLYRVDVSASDGRVWQGQVRVAPGAPGRLGL